jgi:hypothetical protein
VTEKRVASTSSKAHLEEPIARSGNPALFVVGLMVRLSEMDSPFRLAKIMWSDTDEVSIVGIVKDRCLPTKNPEQIQVIRWGALALDKYPMPEHWGKYDLIGGECRVPVDNIRGFMWVQEADIPAYLKQFTQNKEPN